MRSRIQELINILHNKDQHIPGIKITIAKTALIKLAQILHRDEVPVTSFSPQQNYNTNSPQDTTSEGGIKKGFILPQQTEKEFQKILNTVHQPITQNDTKQNHTNLQNNLNHILTD